MVAACELIIVVSLPGFISKLLSWVSCASNHSVAPSLSNAPTILARRYSDLPGILSNTAFNPSFMMSNSVLVLSRNSISFVTVATWSVAPGLSSDKPLR